MSAHVAHSKTRQKILDAAKERLWHYGFKKTAIDEIAADAGVGKGTVYLYFESKEDIALAIIEQFKIENLEHLQHIAGDSSMPIVERLKELLTLPAITANRRCIESPAALEIVTEVRPHIEVRLRPYQKKEIDLIAGVLEEGIREGVFAIENPARTALTLKAMCAGFWPPNPFVEGCEAISEEIGRIVDLAYLGMRNQSPGPPSL